MVTLNTTRYREVPTGKTSYRRSLFGKFILTVEIQRQINTNPYPTPPPPWYNADKQTVWTADNETEYEKGWRPVCSFYRDAKEEDMQQPLLKKEFTS